MSMVELLRIRAMLDTVDTQLAEWLADNTEEVFEEEPDVDKARGDVQDAIAALDARIKQGGPA